MVRRKPTDSDAILEQIKTLLLNSQVPPDPSYGFEGLTDAFEKFFEGYDRLVSIVDGHFRLIEGLTHDIHSLEQRVAQLETHQGAGSEGG